jgi:hypothetical protein
MDIDPDSRYGKNHLFRISRGRVALASIRPRTDIAMIYQTGGPPACTGEWTVSVAAAGSQFTGMDQGRHERPLTRRRRRRESSLDRGRGLKARHSTRGRFLVLGHMQADDGPRQLAKLVPVPERSHHWHNGAGSCRSVRASPAPARLSVSSSIGACAARNRDRLGGLNRR